MTWVTGAFDNFGRPRLQAEEHHPNREAQGWQHHVVGVLCCRRNWCTSQNRWHHEEGKLCGYIEATSQDISQEVNARSQWVFQMNNDPKHTSKVVPCQGIGVAITKP